MHNHLYVAFGFCLLGGVPRVAAADIRVVAESSSSWRLLLVIIILIIFVIVPHLLLWLHMRSINGYSIMGCTGGWNSFLPISYHILFARVLERSELALSACVLEGASSRCSILIEGKV